jgi:putative ABC transport system permease protein
MWELFLRLNLRHLRGQLLRTGLALIGIIMCVIILVFVPTLSQTITETIQQTSVDVAGKAELEIRPVDGGIDSNVLELIQGQESIAFASPSVMSGGVLTQKGTIMAIMGIEPSLDSQLRSYLLSAGEMPDAEGEALLSEDYAAEMEFQLGDSINLLSIGGLRSLEIVGLLTVDAPISRMNSGDVVVMGIEDAFALNGSRRFSSIALLPVEGSDLESLTTELQALIGDAGVVDSPAGRFQQSLEFSYVTNILLGAVSAIMASFGMVLIYNAIAVSVAQRRSELGLLRALGMESGAIRWMYVLEAGAMGVVGSGIGLVLGVALTLLSQDLAVLPHDFTNMGLLASAISLEIPLWILIGAPLTGIGLSMLTAYFSARQISKIDPTEAMVQIRSETGRINPAKWRIPLAILLVAWLIGFQIFIVPSNIFPPSILIMLANNGIIISMLAMILLYAPIVRLLQDGLPRLMERVFGVDGMLAASNFVRRPKRLMTTGIFLASAVAMGVYISQSVFGYSDFVEDWNRTQNVGDIVVTTAGADPFAPLLPLPEEVVEDIQSRPEVATSIGEREINISYNGIGYSIRAIDVEELVGAGGGFIFTGSDDEAANALAAMLDPEQNVVFVTAGNTTAFQNIAIGSEYRLNTPNGEVVFRVVSLVLGGLNPQQASLIMNRDVYLRYWGDTQVDSLTLVLNPEADSNALRRDLLSTYALRGVVAFDAAEIRQAYLDRTITSIQTVSSMMTGLLITLLIVGIGSTFYILILDRRREIGMLRAAGMSRGQIARTVLLEMLIMFVIGSVVGIPIAVLGHLNQEIFIENLMGIGLKLNLYNQLAMVGFVLLLTIVAGFIPAQVASRTNILDAMRYE